MQSILRVMAAGTLISVEEYLRTSYRPDVEYVDGEIQERNVGERYHSETQSELVILFGYLRKQLPLRVFTEQRVQVRPTRYRVPDICVVLGRRDPPAIFVEPPFLCIEILSRDDTFTSMQERLDDYSEFGVPYIWVIDPVAREAWIFSQGGKSVVTDGILRTSNPEILIDLKDVYAEIDN